jgi:hypothetical protein
LQIPNSKLFVIPATAEEVHCWRRADEEMNVVYCTHPQNAARDMTTLEESESSL